jgi:uncharacterized membrane protein YadS
VQYLAAAKTSSTTEAAAAAAALSKPETSLPTSSTLLCGVAASVCPAAAAYAQNPFDAISKAVTDTVDKTVNGTRNAVNTVTNGETTCCH